MKSKTPAVQKGVKNVPCKALPREESYGDFCFFALGSSDLVSCLASDTDDSDEEPEPCMYRGRFSGGHRA
jgi:hypothetical protein